MEASSSLQVRRAGKLEDYRRRLRLERLEARHLLTFDLSSLNGSNGFTLLGIDDDDFAGHVVGHAGDVNGDGFDDLIVSAYRADRSGAVTESGEAYVVFGKSSAFSSSFSLASLTGSNGFQIQGVNGSDFTGISVGGAGDINGDGFDDIIAGASGAGSAAGKAYVIYGKSGGFAATIDLFNLNATSGFSIAGLATGDELGGAVSIPGDLNGDGLDDLLLAARRSDPSGRVDAGSAYVVFGKSSGFGSSFDLTNLNGSNGFAIHGINANDSLGRAVSGAGDVNGDGIGDLLVGASGADPNATDRAGQTYVVFGKTSSFAAVLDLSTLNGTNGFALNGIDPVDVSGVAVSGVGDINGDGFDDVLVGANLADPNATSFAGESYLVFGKGSAFPAQFELSTLNGTNGFVINGIDEFDFSGSAVGAAGDINGDGFDDLVVGSSDAGQGNRRFAGETYLIYGKASGFAASLNLSSLNDVNGLLIRGVDQYDYSGISVSGTGDIDGDGFDDLLIGAYGADLSAYDLYSGEAYVIFGDASFGPTFNPGNDVLTGNAGANQLVGGPGDDSLIGNGGADVLRGGEGDDLLAVSDAGFADVAGGNGHDILRLDGSGWDLNLTTIPDQRIVDIERLNVSGTGANSVTVNQLEVLNISTDSNTLIVDGDANDSVTLLDSWTSSGTEVIDGKTFDVLTQGAAVLKVAAVMAVGQPGRIIVQKQTDPNGSAQAFEFNPSWGTNFFLSDNEQHDSGFLAPGTYSISEIVPTGWELASAVTDDDDGSNAANIQLDSEEIVTVVFTNRQQGRILVQKQTDSDGSPQSFQFVPSWTSNFFLADGQQHDSGFLSPGSYSVSEIVPAGWELISAITDDDDGSDPANIQLDAGETVTAVFTNGDLDVTKGRILVQKQTDPNGSSQSFQFVPSWTSNFFLADGGQNLSGFLDPGTYSISEIVPAGWELVSAATDDDDGSDPANIQLDAGETVTVVFTNRQQGRILVQKETNPDGSPGSFQFNPSWTSNFSLTDGQQHDSGYLSPGTYSVAEIVPAGWELISATTDDDDGSNPASIVLDAGETVTAVFTNRQQGRILVQKQTDPDGSGQSFEFNPSWTSNFFLTDGAQHDSGFLTPGVYSVDEILPAGWQLISAVTDDDDGSNPSIIQLDAGETVTVVFTNRERGRILVNKQTLPDGSTVSFEFDPSWQQNNFFLSDGQQHDSGFLDAGSYSVSEIVPPGWALISAVTNDDDGTDPTQIILDAGETVTVTFTNRQQGRILVSKDTDPAGTFQSFEFAASWTGNFFLNDGQQHDSGLLTPGSYSVSELVPAGWELISAVTDDDDGSDPGAIQLDPGETVNVVFTNRQQGRIIVDLETIPNGSGQSFEFAPSWTTNFFLSDGQQHDSGFLTSGVYSVSEILPAGWDLFVALSNDDDGNDPGNIQLDPGETVTIEYLHRQLGRILVQTTTDPSGATQSFQFSPSWTTNFFLFDGQQHDSGFLAPGTYSVTELVPAGWTLVSATTDDDDGSNPNNIVLDAGETVTATFSNRQQGRILVEKQTLPNASPQSFEFDSSWTTNFFLSDGGQHDSGFLDPGTYSISEIVPAGWQLVSAVTDDDDGNNPAQIQLDPGEIVTVVFTNQQQGRILVQKQTDPEGSPQSFEFIASWTANFFLADNGQHDSGLLPPGVYSVTEIVPAGWEMLSATTDDDDGSDPGNIQLDAGETVTVVVTNGQLSVTKGRIIVQKQTEPNGSTQSFQFNPSWTSSFSLMDDEQEVSDFLDPGLYSVSEVVPAGWILDSALTDDDDGSDPGNIQLDAGETVTVVFTNRQQGRIIVEKQTTPNGSAKAFEFSPSWGTNFFLLDDQQHDSGLLEPGTYSVSEVVPAGWELVGAVTDDDDGSNPGLIMLDPGETVNVVFTNRQQGRILVEKQTNPGGSAQSFEFNPSWTGNFFLSDNGQHDSGFLSPGTYSVSEIVPAGWELISATTSDDDGNDPGSITLDSAETVTVVFTNRQQGRIIVQKQTDPDGSPQSFEFDPSWTTNFSLSDGGQFDSGFLSPDTYSVSEIVPTGWELVSATTNDDDGSNVAAIQLDPAEVVTVVFTNRQLGRILVEKQTNPANSPQSFQFDPSWTSNFFLADNGQHDSGFLSSGTYSIGEIVPAGWRLVSAVTDDDDGSNPSQIQLDAGETVTVVFTNHQDGRIIVEKQTNPSGSPRSFEFAASWTSNFFLADNGQHDSGFLAPGTYSVSEIVPTDWDLLSVVTDDDDGNDAANIQLDPGETVTVVFTNGQFDVTKGRIVVQKQTLPNGSPERFLINPSWTSSFFLGDDEQQVSGFLDPGTYSVSEVVPSGWTLISATTDDDDGSNPGNIRLDAGETVTVVFTNRQQGRILVQNQTDPNGSAQSFQFDPTWTTNFFLTDNQQHDSGFLAPGTYSVSEILPTGWELASATSDDDDGSNPALIQLDPGETVTVVFTNRQQGRILLNKETIPAGSPQSFEFDPSWTNNFFLTGGQTHDSGFLTPGTYSVSEIVPAGWSLISATTNDDDGSSPNLITLDPGETVDITFSNRQQGRIVVQTQTDPDGSLQSFNFVPSWRNNFSLADDEQFDSGFLAPGTYSVSEIVPTGWELASASTNDDDGSNPAAIQLDAAEVVTVVFTNRQLGRILVQKQTNPNGSSQSFQFNPSWTGDFFLTDNQQHDSGFLSAGIYSVSEIVPAGWRLVSADTDDDNGSNPSQIQLDAGETVTVIFTNHQDGRILVEKQTNPGGSPQSFEFAASWTGNFFLTDQGRHDSGFLTPGTYSVSEIVPAGWDLLSVVTDDDDGNDPGNIQLDPGETVTVVFTNGQFDVTKGRIVVQKQTLPNGSPERFLINPSWTSSFFLGDDEQHVSEFLDPGTYSVSEVVPAGWTLVSATSSDDDGNNPNNIQLDAGETVTVVFTNRQQGRIRVQKQTDPSGSAQTFEFDPSWTTNFFLADNQQHDSGFLAPGTYSVSEMLPAGWELATAATDDDDGNNPTLIQLDPGETVTVVFTNRQMGRIVVDKETSPTSSAQSFEFEPSWTNNFFLTATQTHDSGFLTPGTYSVSEIVPDGWSLVSSTTNDDDGNSPNLITLDPGETVNVTFSNRQQGRIIVETQTNPDGSSQSFEFDPSWAANFSLADGGQFDSGFLAPGAYSVSEIVPSGWELVSATTDDDDGNNPAAIQLDAAETVTVSFVNRRLGRIIVEKSTNPSGSSQTFEFDPSWTTNFFLADGQRHDSGFLTPRIYSVIEIVPPGWELVNATTDDDDGSNPASIRLDAGETVTVVFTNRQLGRILVQKQTEPDGALQTFQFDPSWTSNFFLRDNQQHDSGPLLPGSYSVSEIVPAGWELLSAVTDDDDGSDPANIQLDAGETVTATFTNSRPDVSKGRVIVQNQTLPNGSPRSFQFNASWANPFFLADNEQHVSGFLDPGTYSVSESVPSGWVLVSAVTDDDDGNNPGTIRLDAGETVTVVFTNRQDGRIIIQQQAEPDASPQLFEFDPSWTTDFSLRDNQQHDSGLLTPGAYSIDQTLPPGWQLTSVTSDDDDSGDPTSIQLDPGETVTVIFANTLFGDFDRDGNLGCSDIALLGDEVFAETDDPLFDVTGDRQVNNADVTAWIRNVKGTVAGDMNLDLVVDAADFGSWIENRFQLDTRWCSGDLNGDGVTDGSDFNIWNDNRFDAAPARLDLETRQARTPRAPLAGRMVVPIVLTTLGEQTSNDSRSIRVLRLHSVSVDEAYQEGFVTDGPQVSDRLIRARHQFEHSDALFARIGRNSGSSTGEWLPGDLLGLDELPLEPAVWQSNWKMIRRNI